MDKQRLEKRDKALAAVNKKYGKGSAMLGPKPVLDIETWPTGSLGLDKALGVGGYPKGRIIEIFGAEASGKSTTTLHAIAEIQKRGGSAALIDAEHATDPTYAASIGVDMDELVFSQPDSGEEALEIADQFVSSGAFDIIVIDSVAALVPQAELDGEMGQAHIGIQARLMGQALRKLGAKVSKSKTILFFVNQLRVKVGVMFGNPETTSGGNALKFYASVRLRCTKLKLTDAQKASPFEIHTAKIKVEKNKVSPPFKTAEFEVIYGTGIDRAGEVVKHAVHLDLIEQTSPGRFEWDGSKFHGIVALKDAVLKSPEVIDSLENKVRERYGIPAV